MMDDVGLGREMMGGGATVAETTVYGERFPDLTYVTLGETGWRVSQAGFGCYRVSVGVDAHYKALKQALLRGINLIDTSTNYADGGSEALVGQVLRELIEQEEIEREQVVVVSKVGYIQGQNYQMSQAHKAAGMAWPELVTYAEGLEHCLHPDFLADQLDRSRARLGLQQIDCYLLHNPEYYLNWAYKQGVALTEARAEYERRLAQAFAYLETAVADGLIQCYGVSSNTFVNGRDDPAFTSLERVLAMAERVRSDHHLRVIQLPMNLLETGGATEKNQSNGRSVLAVAHEEGIGVLVNRPLNAIYDNILMRLVDVPKPAYPATNKEVSTTVDTLAAVEVSFQRKILPLLSFDVGEGRQLLELMAVGRLLQSNWRGFGSYQNWNDLRAQYLIPRAHQALAILAQQSDLPEGYEAWRDQYVEMVNTALADVSAIYQKQSAEEGERLQELAGQAEALWVGETLSQTAVAALRSTEGVTSVLVGMRRLGYVMDVVAGLKRPLAIEKRDKAWRFMNFRARH